MKDFDIKDPDGYIITFGNGGYYLLIFQIAHSNKSPLLHDF